MKDFDFQIKRNQEDIEVVKEKIDGLSKDLDDLVSLYEIVSEQMNPFVGLSNVTKKRIEALENFTKQLDEVKDRLDEIEALAEKGGLQRTESKELIEIRKRMKELERAKTEGTQQANNEEMEEMRERMRELEEAAEEKEKELELREKEQKNEKMKQPKKEPEEEDAPTPDEPKEPIEEPSPPQPLPTPPVTSPDTPQQEEIIPTMKLSEPQLTTFPTPQDYPQQPETEGTMMPDINSQTTDSLDALLNQALEAFLREQQIDMIIEEFISKL